MNSLVDSGLHRIIFVSNKVNTDQKRSNCDLCIKGKNHYHCALCSKEFPLRRVEYFKRHLDWHDEQKGTAEEQARNLFKITSRNEKCAVNDCIELLRHYHCPGCLRIFKRRDQFMDYHAARCGEFNSLRRKDRHGQELFIEGLDRYEEEQETQVTVEEQEAVGFSATDQEHGLADKVLINEGDNALDVNRGKSKKFKLEHDDIENYQDTLEMGSNNGNFGFEGTGKNKTDLDESIHIDSKSDTASRICRSIDIRLNRIIFVSNSVNLKSRKDDCESCVKGKGHYHCSLCSKGFHKRREEYFIKHLNWHDAGGDLDKELEKSDCDAEGCHLTYVHFHCPGCSKVYKQNGQCMDNHVNRCQKLQGDASMSPCGTPSMSINSDTESNGIDNLVIENTYETTTNQNEVDSTPSGSIITLSERNAAIESVMCTSSRTVSSTMSVVDVGLKTALSSFPWTTTTPPSSSTPEVRVRSGLNRIAFVSPKNAEEFRADCDLCIENENHYHCTLCPKTFAKRREEYFVKHLERHDKGNITACKAEIIGCIVMQKHYHCPFCKELCVEDDNHYQCTFCSKTFGKWHSEEIEPATAWQIEEADPTTTQQLDKADPTTTCMLGIPGCPMTQNHIHCQGCKKPVECDPRQSGIVEHSKVCEKFKSLVKNTQVSHVNFIDKFISAIGHNYQISCSVSSGTVEMSSSSPLTTESRTLTPTQPESAPTSIPVPVTTSYPLPAVTVHVPYSSAPPPPQHAPQPILIPAGQPVLQPVIQPIPQPLLQPIPDHGRPTPPAVQPPPPTVQVAAQQTHPRPGSSQSYQSKYGELLNVIEDLGREIKPTYAGSKMAQERLKKGIMHARSLVRECLAEVDKSSRQ